MYRYSRRERDIEMKPFTFDPDFYPSLDSTIESSKTSVLFDTNFYPEVITKKEDRYRSSICSADARCLHASSLLLLLLPDSIHADVSLWNANVSLCPAVYAEVFQQ